MDSVKLLKRCGVLAVCLGMLTLAADGYAMGISPETSKDSNFAEPTGAAPAEVSDPFEPINRGIYWFNRGLDFVILRPVAVGYRTVVPEQGRAMVTNALDNLYAPVTLANSILQGDPKNSFATLWRFLLNSTVGVGGLFDPASANGLKNRRADFGETLAFYGAGPGPYIMLPIIGPSNVRDSVGALGDMLFEPINYAPTAYWLSAWGVTAVDERSSNMKLIDDIYDNSIDAYATLRSGYAQHRVSEIRRGIAARDKALEGCYNYVR